MQVFGFSFLGVNSKHGGGTQKTLFRSLPWLPEEGRFCRGLGDDSPQGQKNFENFAIFSMKKYKFC